MKLLNSKALLTITFLIAHLANGEREEQTGLRGSAIQGTDSDFLTRELALKKKKNKYYAVARGRTVGVYDTWDECNAQVRAYPGASHKVYRDTFFSPSFSPFLVLWCRPSANATRIANEPYLF